MSASESNKAAIAAKRKTIFNIESNVLSNKALVYQSRSMIEENRLMIMSNYSAAFMGNRQLANANTDEIFANRSAILGAMDADGPVQENYVAAQTNKSSLDYLEHRSKLNSSVLEISAKMADINAQLVAVNQEIMAANQSIVEFNFVQIVKNSEMLSGALRPSESTVESNTALIAGNTAAMADLSGNVEKNHAKMEEILETSSSNASKLMANKEQINERRIAIMENRKGILANKQKIG